MNQMADLQFVDLALMQGSVKKEKEFRLNGGLTNTLMQ